MGYQGPPSRALSFIIHWMQIIGAFPHVVSMYLENRNIVIDHSINCLKVIFCNLIQFSI